MMTSSMLENLQTAEHQKFLDTAYRNITDLVEQILFLQTSLYTSQKNLPQLVAEYQSQRYQRQEEIWRSRCLTRCTGCFNVPPDKVVDRWDKRIPTPWGGWGLMPIDEAHFASISGKTYYRGDHYDSGGYETYLHFHRLCGNCYLDKLRGCATSGGGFRDLWSDEVEEINQILAKKGSGYEAHQQLSKKWGSYDKIEVCWHELPIPEQAYEIGVLLRLDKSLLG